MDINKLYKILEETTFQFRKGEVYEGAPELVKQMKDGVGDEGLKGGGVLEVYAMPHESEAKPDIEKVDMEFIVIGVKREAAEKRKAELIEILNEYPNPERLAGGPSYIEVGGEIGDQGAAFQLFALGKALKLWDVITPAKLGFKGAEARQMAGMGYVMITGYRKQSEAA
jgi:hypothetical protein